MLKPFEIELLAGELYRAYCEAVGGKAFNGDPLPTWEAFKADPKKAMQSGAWLKVAETTDRIYESGIKLAIDRLPYIPG